MSRRTPAEARELEDRIVAWLRSESVRRNWLTTYEIGRAVQMPASRVSAYLCRLADSGRIVRRGVRPECWRHPREPVTVEDAAQLSWEVARELDASTSAANDAIVIERDEETGAGRWWLTLCDAPEPLLGELVAAIDAAMTADERATLARLGIEPTIEHQIRALLARLRGE